MENLQEEVTEIEVLTAAKTPVYFGIGFINSNDTVNYFASLAPDPKGSYKFKIFKIRNEGVLIHLDNGSADPLTNPDGNMYQIPDFKITKQQPIPKEYKVVLYHEKGEINRKSAKEVFEKETNATNTTATKSILLPGRTGTGTIKP